jgi:hypothetical protein
MVHAGLATVARKTQRGKAPEKPQDERVAVIVLKDTRDYRDWLTGLSETTLISTATIVRDALSKWAADRGLPAPPTVPGRRRRPQGGGK